MNNNDIAIKVENISKCYRIGEQSNTNDSISSSISNFIKSPIVNYRKYRSLYRFNDIKSEKDDSYSKYPSNVIWALKDLSFEIKSGEVVGIIGRNGAGKSTVLKVLSRITEPTTGRIEIRGKISSLLEVGTGFHPELTGRENVYLNGTILGMRKNEIEQKFDDIVRFAGVEKFIDTPVKRYSSGMKVRLAFAVAAYLEPEILIIDEVLAVGDHEFQAKCMGKMKEVASQGRTVVFVSHNMVAVESLCTSCILIKDGEIEMYSDTKSVISSYISSANTQQDNLLRDRKDRKGNGNLLVTDISVSDDGISGSGIIRSGGVARISIFYENFTNQIQDGIYIILGIYDSYDRPITFLVNKYYKKPLVANTNKGVFECCINKFPLAAGRYNINIKLDSNLEVFDWVQQAYSFEVIEGDFFGKGEKPISHIGGVFIEHDWK